MVVKSRVLVKRLQSHSQQFVLNVNLSHFGLFFLLLIIIVRGGGIFEPLHTSDFERVYCFLGLAALLWQAVRQENP